MSRFYFDIETDGGPIHDDLGDELPDLDAACREAAQVVCDLLRGAAEKSATGHEIAVRVRDDASRTLCRVTAGLRVELSSG